MRTDRQLVDYLGAAHVKFNGGQGDDAPLVVTSFSQVAPLVPRRVRARYADVLRASEARAAGRASARGPVGRDGRERVRGRLRGQLVHRR